MPDLPTLTVTNAQATRILAAFGTQTEYRRWLRDMVINHVVARESTVTRTDMEAEIPDPASTP